MAPCASSQPVPARKPPTTGYGRNRIRLPSLKTPNINMNAPVASVVRPMVANTVAVVCPWVAVAGMAASTAAMTTPRIAAGTSWLPPIVPRSVANRAMTMPDSVAPNNASPTARLIMCAASPGRRRVEKETAKMTSIKPTIRPAISAGKSRFGRNSSASCDRRETWDGGVEPADDIGTSPLSRSYVGVSRLLRGY